MLKKDPKNYTDALGKTNRIVEGTIIKGNISSQADFRLDGELTGNFNSEGKLVIGPRGVVKGEVYCKNVDIEGTFEGKIQVGELLNVKTNAIIKGDVIVGRLAVEPGADFTATCVMKSNIKSLQTTDGEKAKEKTA